MKKLLLLFLFLLFSLNPFPVLAQESYPINLSCNYRPDLGGWCSNWGRSLYYADSSGSYTNSVKTFDYEYNSLFSNDTNYPFYFYQISSPEGRYSNNDISYFNLTMEADKKYKIIFHYEVKTKDTSSLFVNKDILYKYIKLNTVLQTDKLLIDEWKFGETSASLLHFNLGVTQTETSEGVIYNIIFELQPRVTIYGIQFNFEPIETSCSNVSPTCDVPGVISIGSSIAGMMNFKHVYPIFQYGNTNSSNVIATKELLEVDKFDLTTSIVGSVSPENPEEPKPPIDLGETNSKLDNIDDALTNDHVDDFDLSDFDLGIDDKNSPISSLITMPLTLLDTFLTGLKGTCSNYSIPFLFNTELTFPCLDLKKYFGSKLWAIIDAFICLWLIYEIAMMCISFYEKLTTLDDVFNSLYVPKHARNDEYVPKHARGGGR